MTEPTQAAPQKPKAAKPKAAPEATIHHCLLELQRRVHKVTKDAKNPHKRSTYASLTAVADAVYEHLHDLGCYVSSRTYVAQFGDNQVCWICTTIHHVASDTKVNCELPMEPAQLRIDRTEVTGVDPQSVGSLITYYRRYSLSMLTGLVTEDDDGESASRSGRRAGRSSLPDRGRASEGAPNDGVVAQLRSRINNAEDLASLMQVGGTIKSIQNSLQPDELQGLRALFASRKADLEDPDPLPLETEPFV